MDLSFQVFLLEVPPAGCEGTDTPELLYPNLSICSHWHHPLVLVDNMVNHSTRKE